MPSTLQAAETQTALESAAQQQRCRQLRGLLWLALLVGAGSLLRTALHGELHHLILTPRWWRIW